MEAALQRLAGALGAAPIERSPEARSAARSLTGSNGPPGNDGLSAAADAALRALAVGCNPAACPVFADHVLARSATVPRSSGVTRRLCW